MIEESVMWTPATRLLDCREGLRCETNLLDAEWMLIAPLLPQPFRTGRPSKWPMREIVNAIFYCPRGGIGWRLLPLGFPPRGHRGPLVLPVLRRLCGCIFAVR
jgi:Putative transposase of IS4/5 family (DUF4096)